jgi:hypothetical protein
VVIETPFAAFVPHATAYYPEWFDGKERGKTGQELIFLNSDKLLHNVRATSSNKDFQGFNAIVMPRTQLNPSKQFKKSSQHVTPHRLPYMISNSIYSWMSANVWCFDHPYFAITKTDGSFRIPRVPAGMEVQVMAWHESQGWLFTKEGKTMTLKKGKNVLDFEMSAK